MSSLRDLLLLHRALSFLIRNENPARTNLNCHPLSRLSMDLKVMSRSKKGHRYILCIIYEVTTYLIMVPICEFQWPPFPSEICSVRLLICNQCERFRHHQYDIHWPVFGNIHFSFNLSHFLWNGIKSHDLK